jgi:branched-chain amino acid transport system substrate-binding protein
MKRMMGLLATVGCVLIAAGCGDSGGGSSSSAGSGGGGGGGTITIGNLEPLTGAAASLGVLQNQAVELAVDEINAKGGVDVAGKKYKFALDTQDDKADPTTGVAALQKLLSQNGRHFLVGTLASSVMGAEVPILKQKKDVIDILAGTSYPPASKVDGVYRMQFAADGYIRQFAQAVAAQKTFTKVGFLWEKTNESLVDIMPKLNPIFTAAGKQVVASEQWSLGDTDYAGQIAKLKRSGAEALLIASGVSTDPVVAIKQARQQGFTGPIYEEPAPTIDVVKDAQATGQMNDVYTFYTPYSEDQVKYDLRGEQATAFSKAFKAKYGKEPGLTSAMGYDDPYVLAAALKKAGTVTDYAKIKAALDSLTVAEVPELVQPILPWPDGKLFKAHETKQAFVLQKWDKAKQTFVSTQVFK